MVLTITAESYTASSMELYGDKLVGIVGVRGDARRKIKHRAMIWGVYTKASHRGRGIAYERRRQGAVQIDRL